MPILHTVLATALLFQSTTFAAEPPFPDMERSWWRYQDAVSYLVSNGIIDGYDDGTFKPENAINRAEFLKLVYVGKQTEEPTRRCFSDINPEEWYARYICTAKEEGIIDGYPDGTYQPERSINFAEAIKIATGAYGWNIADATGEQWFRPYTEELDNKDLLGEHSYLPWSEINRVRAADLIWRLERYEQDQYVPRYSAGCSVVNPSAPTTVQVDGRTRSYLLTVPSGYSHTQRYPLVVAFHGRTNGNSQVRSYYRLDRELTDAIIAYPAALSNGNGTYSWSDQGETPSELRDIALYDAIVEQLASQYCIDFQKLYVVGHSLGAWFSNSVACIRGDVVRASATVGGSSVITDCAGPAAAMIAHNPADRLAPFSGSEANRQQRVEDNNCSWNMVPDSPELNCEYHMSCVGGNDVLWCPHNVDEGHGGVYYPHTWPRSTASHIKEFFAELER